MAIPTKPPSKTKFEYVVSSGGVVFRRFKGSFRVCLIYRKSNDSWGLPKGHMEKGETPQETALREVLEETGLRSEPAGKLGEIRYFFQMNGKRYSKTVYFFLLKHTGGNTRKRDKEADDVRWFPMGEALETVTYPTEKDVLKKAAAKLKSLK